MMTMLVSATLLAASLAASPVDDLSPFYRTPYAQVTADAAARAAERSAAKEDSATHRSCGTCGCHGSQADKGGSTEKR
jgi:hypothetical protein